MKEIPEALVRALMYIHIGTKTKVNIGTHLFVQLEVNIGLHQRS